MVKVTYKGETRNIPDNYLKGLKGYERTKQIKSIFEGKARPKTKAISKESSYTIQFNKKYGEQLSKMKGGKSKRNISKITGIPYKALDEVMKKGEGAYYSSGSRPNQTPQSWGRARMYSYILGGNARKIDKEVTKKYNVKFP
jgi:hypothetical protein